MFSLFSHLRKLFGAKPPADEATDATETESIEKIQTDTSYSKELEHQQPMPAPSWTLPLCGPLLNRLLSKNGASNTTNNLKSTSTLCADCISEKDDFVIIDPSTTEDAPETDSVQAKELLCDFDIEKGTGGRRKFVMHLTEDIDTILHPEEIAFIVDLLEKLRNGVAKDAPIKYSTRRLADLLKTRAARWADTVGKQADEYIKEEAVKVERIRRKAEEDEEEVDGQEVD